MFADDTNVFLSGKDVTKLYSLANDELVRVTDWLAANKLSLNINKTKCILFSPNRARKLNFSQTLSVYNKPIEQVENITFLGIVLNEDLSWKPHMLFILQKLRRNFGIISKIK